MRRFAYYPAVDTADELTDLLSRAAWFLTFSPIERIYVPISDPELARMEWRVASGMDPAIEGRFDALRKLIEFVPVGGHEEVGAVLDRADAILRWKLSDESEPQSVALRRRAAKKRIFEVDPQGVRQEGGNYIEVSFWLEAAADTRELHRSRLATLASQLGTFERGFVLATGPSVAQFDKFDYEDSLSVVCNTVILNEELMETVKPQFVTFADPIFHFGPSRYAAAFRANLREAAERYPFTICTPAKYFSVFEAAMPDLTDRMVAIPYRKDREFNFDLASDFELRTTANVLTLMMLPLAATFARRIGILGCDGRPMSEDKYFWSHSRSTQINDEMANIRGVHPGFFDIEYNDYYLEHCETLDQQLEVGERAGRKFESLAPSHIPALHARESDGASIRKRIPALPPPVRTSSNPRLLVIDPTRVNSPPATGRLKGTLLEGWPEAEFLQIYRAKNGPARGRVTIARTLEQGAGDVEISTDGALAEIARFMPDVIYCRPIINEHPELHSLALKALDRHYSSLVSHIMDDWPARLARANADGAREVDTELRNLFHRSQASLSISEKMSTVFEERYGVAFEPLANGVDPGTFQAAAEAVGPTKEERDEVILRYVGGSTTDMTFESLLDVARAVDALQGEVPVRLEVYTWPPGMAVFEKAVAGLRGVDVILGGNYESDQYAELLAGADVLLLTYNFDEQSIEYIGLSMPNKLPECLASNSALLAVGPPEANGIDYVLSNGLAYCVTVRDHKALTRAIRKLATDAEYRKSLASRGQKWAFEQMNVIDARERFERVMREAATLTPAGRDDMPTVFLIDPDSLDRGDHSIAYNDELFGALERLGCEVKVLCNRAIESAAVRERPQFFPVLSSGSRTIGQGSGPSVEDAARQFEAEVSAAVSELGDGKAVIYMHTGSLNHASALARLLERDASLCGTVNLFWDAEGDDEEWEQWLSSHRETAMALVDLAQSLKLTVPTARMRDEMAAATGLEFAVTPQPSTAVADAEFDASLDSERDFAQGLGVIFPGTAGENKGYSDSLAGATRIARQTSLRTTIRDLPSPSQALPESVSVISGALNDEAFIDLLLSNDLAVLPYEPRGFNRRTSGLLIDSIYHGLPVVTTQGTWLGDFVEHYGCGAVAPTNSPNKLANAVYDVALGYADYAANSRSAARDHFTRNSWHALASSIVEPHRRVFRGP